jgi:adenosylcobinamide-phosphate synthase
VFLPLGIPAHPFAQPLVILLAAMVMDAVIGEGGPLFKILPHPITLLGRFIDALDKRLNRPQRSEATRKWRGVLTLVIVTSVVGVLGWAVQDLAVHALGAWPVMLIATWTLIAQRSLAVHVGNVATALDSGGLLAGRQAVSHIVGRDPERLDSGGVARAAIESCAENFSDGVIAPIFWFVVAGLPGMAIYKAVNTLDSMIGHMNPHYRSFGWASARFDDLVNLIPARLSGFLLSLAALFVAGCNPRRALATMIRDARKHRSPNAGWPEAAMAGALGLSLAGPRSYPGHTVDDPWIGIGRTSATADDIRQAVRVLWLAAGFSWLLILLTALITRV